MQQLKVYVPAHFSFSEGIRDLAKESGKLCGFSDYQCNMLRLVTDEIFMNAIRYGSDKESHIYMEILLDIENESIIVAIEDEGKGEKKIQAEDLKKIIEKETEHTSLTKTHGRGLAQITSNLVEAYEILNTNEGGLRIEFKMGKKEDPKQQKTTDTIAQRSEKILPEKHMNVPNTSEDIEVFMQEIAHIFVLHNQDAFRLILDFSKNTYIHSTFLGKMIEWQEHLKPLGGEVIIKSPSKETKEIIDLLGMQHLFAIE